ncbi:MAG: polysaccharide biosynthesis protein [Bacteroidia bacterium]
MLFKKNIPRWIIFLIDLGIVLFSFVLAYALRFNFEIPPVELERLSYIIPIVLVTRGITFLVFRTYAGVIRYTSTRDAMRILGTIGVGSLIFLVTNPVFYKFTGIFFIPFSIIIIDYITAVFVMTASRLLVKVLYLEMKNPTHAKTNVIIYGAGESGMITKRALDRDAGTKYKVTAFIDDDEKKRKNKLEGITVYSAKKDLEQLIKGKNIAFLIISIQNISPQRKADIIEFCLTHNIKVLNVPPVNNWINGELSFKQIKKIKIEDLLNREEIMLDVGQIKREIAGKTVLISGAAGSIGSEIVRQIIPFNPHLIVILDQAESPLYEIELELLERYRIRNLETIVGDIKDVARMRMIFEMFRPDIVFHAAAYKHVPMMELNPAEAVMTNSIGTMIMADLAVEFKARKFVMISTDKAVNPTNVMGASKRVAEIYTQSLNEISDTKFITTRFGNVLGSNGSVLPRFRKQIEEGGPITITHPDVTRFFMTIPEACRLVLEAGAMGEGGEIFLFDMGNSVKIADLARKMVQLSGLTLGKDIQLVYTGLRPGEKLFEELLTDKENTLPTHHPKIMIASVQIIEFKTILSEISKLKILSASQNNEAIVRKLKEIVPEFISKNSEYEKMDKKTVGND